MYFLSQIIPWSGSARVSTPISKAGKRLSLYGDVTATVKVNGTSHTRRFRSTAPIDIAGKLNITLCEPVADNSGINALFLNEYYTWDMEAWVGFAKKASLGDPKMLSSQIEGYEYGINSEVGLLYNLIRQHALLTIKGKPYDPKSDYYNDGHLAVDYRTAFGVNDGGSWALVPDEFHDFSGSSSDTNVINWPGMTVEQATIYACALGPLEGRKGYPLAASSPALTSKLSLGNSVGDQSPDGPWYKADKVKAALRELVVRGRMFSQFDCALNMVAQTACHFAAPVAEAIPLCASEHDIQLPEFRSFRFALRHCMTGESGGERPSARACFKAWIASPASLWIYSAIMRSAAEFRGSVTYGTDFDTTGELDSYADSMDLTGGVGKWLNYAASALGAKIYAQPGIPLGAGIANYDTPIPMRVVGTLIDYNVVEDVGDGARRRVRIAPYNDERRQGMHSRLLFALGLLPESKAGKVATKAKFEVRRSRSNSNVCSVPGYAVGPYLTMCRAHGWDATIKMAQDRSVKSWSDNESRMVWSTSETMEFAGSYYDVQELTWRGEPLNKQRIDPAIPAEYEYEMAVVNVGTLYEYDRPEHTGDRPSNVAVLPKGVSPMPTKVGIDLVLQPPTIDASEQDFGEVPPLSGQIAVGGAVDDPLPAPAEEEAALDTSGS